MTITQHLELTILTQEAGEIVKKHLNSMFDELLKLEHVEFLYEEDGIPVTAKLNNDTSFRECFCEEIDNLLLEKLRNI